MTTRLFIENQEVELDESVQFAITKQFEDLSNPTTIINSWSKTISIPFTEKNNILFGHIYNADRLIAEGGDSITGIYFNPYKKLDFRLQWGDSVLMVGYAKMNKVKQNNGKGTYEITLFGELGKVFQELKKITFDTTTTEPDYLISGNTWVDEKINRSLVYDSWTSSGQTHEILYPKLLQVQGGMTINHPAYNVTDIIGFAPNNSFSDDFKYDTYQVSENESNTFENELGTGFTQDTGVEPKTVIPNGYLPRERGEYRSYHQLPFIYWNKLFQIFQSKAESITGYQFELDNSWFNSSNPYWYNLVYMLKAFPFTQKGGIYNNTYTFKFGDYGIIGSSWQTNNNTLTSTVWQTEKTITNFAVVSGSSVETLSICDFGYPISTWNIPENSIVAFSFPFRSMIGDTQGREDNPYLNPDNALLLQVIMVGENGETRTKKFLIKRSTSTITEADAIEIINDTHIVANTQDYITSNIEVDFTADRDTFGDSVTFYFKQNWKTTSNPSTSNTTLQGNKVITASIANDNNKTPQVNIIKGSFKSDSRFILNDLWNNDYNLFDEIIRYCKMYRISISVDELNKKIVFKPFTKYFESYTVEDWTNKVDKSKDYIITPITFENKYVLFDYKDSETQLGKDYKEKYGVNYGEYRLITDYNFNSDTKKLFENIPQSIINTDNVLSWKNLRTNHKIIYSFPAELYVYNKDKDNKQKDIFGSFYFHKGTKNFDGEAKLNLVPVKIADDTDFQLANNTYFYSKGGYRLLVSSYPFLDIVSGDNMCVFNIPKENYTYLNNYTNKNTIYTNFWEKYINERYNIQNKKITCYIRLKPTEYQSFEWNHFVKIGNQLCIVNKIYDYDATSNQPVKVDLITIQDISGYTTNNYV